MLDPVLRSVPEQSQPEARECGLHTVILLPHRVFHMEAPFGAGVLSDVASKKCAELWAVTGPPELRGGLAADHSAEREINPEFAAGEGPKTAVSRLGAMALQGAQLTCR